ncbi:MAG: efflux RND transporter periplasmic adaptor subunit [Chitinophagaceae bacterium]
MQRNDIICDSRPNYLFFYTLLLCIAVSCTNKEANPKQITSRVSPTPVQIAGIVTASGMNSISASGLISTAQEARLSFKIGGVIEKIYVQEGQQVRKGQLLASLYNTEIAAQVQQVQLAVDKAQRDYVRASNLYKDSVVTLEQLQNSKTGLAIAQQNLQQVQFNSHYANIYAPSNGFIVKKLLNTGEITAPGTPVLAISELGSQSKWVLRAGVSDREWASIEKGNRAIITTDAFPGMSFPATVTKKALAADVASGSFLIELELDVKGKQPAVGMFGKAIITPSTFTKGYTIPYEALLEANGNKGFVFVTDDRKTVQKVVVTISSIEKDRVLITEGLEGHSFVVISGSPYLTDGAAIQINQ